MGFNRDTPEESVTKLRQVEVPCGHGKPRADAIRQVQTAQQTFHRRRKQSGGKGNDKANEPTRVRNENAHPRRAAPGRCCNRANRVQRAA